MSNPAKKYGTTEDVYEPALSLVAGTFVSYKIMSLPVISYLIFNSNKIRKLTVNKLDKYQEPYGIINYLEDIKERT